MGIRPSELWGITSPLAAFYFDRAVRNWARFVDNQTSEAEATVRAQMRNRKGSDSFAAQAREVTFNKLLGLSTESLYAAPPKQSGDKANKPKGKKEKIDLDKIQLPYQMSVGRK